MSMRKVLTALACCAASCLSLRAAQPYSSYAIAEGLKKGCAVVRNYEVCFERPGITSATERQTLVLTVLNENGDRAAGFVESTDKRSSLKSFSGEIFDSHGNSVRRIKRTDLQATQATQGLASDYTTVYYEPHHPSYPYTVKYEWEVVYRDGILAFPVFDPMPTSRCAIERAVYRLTLPAGTKFHWRGFNMPSEPEKSAAGNNEVWQWTVSNLPGIEPEAYSPPSTELYPMVFFSPHDFSYDGIAGCMEDWKSYGEWQWKLLKGRNVLPDALKAQIDKMTADAQTQMEKIAILYDYLAATTRYVSIQIGIGGLQPMTAAEVYKNKFGDCKGLSNYMQAMLAYCGIDSYYTEIGMYSQRVRPDFANVYATNHAILQVPVGADTLWLECTSPELPLGYTHDDIAGRYALVYRDGTTEVVKVNAYPDSLHRVETTARLTLAADGGLTGHVEKTYRMDRYVDERGFRKKNSDERMNRIISTLGLTEAYVSAVTYAETKGLRPSCTIGYDVQARQLGSKTGTRTFVSVTPLRKKSDTRLSKAARKYPIVVESGGGGTETVTIDLPEGTTVESLPSPVVIVTQFGRYSIVALPTGSGVVINRSLLMRSGRYDASEYGAFKSFLDSVASADAANIVLKSN